MRRLWRISRWVVLVDERSDADADTGRRGRGRSAGLQYG
jgi:hypothetical protein